MPTRSDCVSCSSAQAAYAALSMLFLLSFGVANNISQPHSEAWPRAVCAACCLLLGVMVMTRVLTGNVGSPQIWVFGCMLYGALILVVGLMHAAALADLPGSARVNVEGMSAAMWLGQNFKFSLFYFCFPVLCVLQYLVIKRLTARTISRILCACMSLSFLCATASQIAPRIIKTHWFMREGRFWGLLRTPNSYGLAISLLLPWVVAPMVRRGGRTEKLLYGCCLALALKGVLDSGSRTGLAMVLAFIVLAPTVVAVAPTPLGRRTRAALMVVLPLLLVCVAAGVVALAKPGGLGGLDVLASRVGDTWERLREDGVRGVFFQHEVRGFHALVAWLMVLRAPLAGWGPGGFYRQFSNAVFLATGRVRPVTDSALNHYLMIGGDLGVPALAVHLFVLLLPLWMGCRILRKSIDSDERVLIRLLLLGNLIFMVGVNFMPPAYFQDALWLWTAQLAYLVVAARRNGLLPVMTARRWRAVLAFSAVGIAGPAFLGAVTVAWGAMGYSAMHRADWWPWRYGRNCYNLERSGWGEGCWCTDDAVLQIPFFGRPPEMLRVPINVRHPDAKEDPVVVRYGGLRGTTRSVVFRSPSWKTLTIPVTEEYLYSPTASRERHRWKLPWLPPTAKSLAPREIWYVVLSIGVSRTWVPEQWGRGPDPRELAVKVLVPIGRFDRGCFRADSLGEGIVRWCTTDAVIQVPIRGTIPDEVEVSFGAFHPGIEDSSVTIRYGGLSGPTDSLVVSEKSWNKVTIPLTDDYLYRPSDIHDAEWRDLLSVPVPSALQIAPPASRLSYLLLSVQTSRGWRPGEWSARGHTQEVGLAVRLPDFRGEARSGGRRDDQ
jgi:hypothetical protein